MPPTSLQQLDARAFDYWKARHLLNRAGFGGTPGQVRALANLGLERAVEHVVDYHRIDQEPVPPDRFEADIMQPLSRQDRQVMRRAREAGDEETLAEFRRKRQQRQRDDRRQMAELQAWWLTRMIETPRPLEEKMALFWHGHFATSYRGVEDSFHLFMQNQLFRRHAVGSFRDLAHAIIRDPAMLRYLNNDQNRKQQPNENLARELMELFTLGEGNEYAEADIKEGARALTGYTFVDDDFVDLRSRRYRLTHDHGPKRILGRTGQWNGDDFVELILERRACAEFICWKLYRYFVDDRPGEPDEEGRQFVIDLAKLLRGNDYRLRPVLKTLFSSAHFYEPARVAALIKSPIQLIVQAVRSLLVPVRNVRALLSAAELMGQSLFFPPSVKGWEGGRAWINTSTLFVRQNLMVYLLTGRRPEAYGWQRDGRRYDATHLIEHLRLPGGGVEVREAVTYLLWFNFGRQPEAGRVQALERAARRLGGDLDNRTLIELLALITAAPEYQLC